MSTDRFAEIINYLSAISREVGAFRAETKARFDSLEQRVGGLETRMDRLEVEVRTGFEVVHKDLRVMTDKMDVLNGDMLTLRAKHRDLDERVRTVESREP